MKNAKRIIFAADYRGFYESEIKAILGGSSGSS